MASFAISHLSSVSSSSSLCFNFGTKIRISTSFSRYPNLTLKTKSLTVKASSTSLDYAVDKSSVSSKFTPCYLDDCSQVVKSEISSWRKETEKGD